MSMPCSDASLRTAGVARTSERSVRDWPLPSPDGAAGTVVGARDGAPTVTPVCAGALERGADAAGASATCAPDRAGVAPAADEAAAASSAVSKTARSVPIGTVCPSSTLISRSVPDTGDGISVFTLSVCTSTRRSYLFTFSPGFLSHLPIVPSVTDSPSFGIFNSNAMGPPPLRGRGFPGRASYRPQGQGPLSASVASVERSSRCSLVRRELAHLRRDLLRIRHEPILLRFVVRHRRNFGSAEPHHRCIKAIERFLGDERGDLGTRAEHAVVLVQHQTFSRLARFPHDRRRVQRPQAAHIDHVRRHAFLCA